MTTMTGVGLSVHVARLVHIYRADGHDVAALSGVDLSIDAGSTLALLGPSGAGKSTLLSLIAGMERPTAGTITIGDERTDQLADAEMDRWRGDRVALVLQGGQRNLLPYLSVIDNIRLAQWGSTTGAAPDPDDLLDWVGIPDDLVHRKPPELTEAQAQLVALCVGAASGPGLLLADEPTASLAADATHQVIEALRRLNDSLGTTILTVTHDPVLAGAMDRTVTIRDGRVGAQAHDGVELAVVSPDGALPLPDDVLDELPPGTLLRVQRDETSDRLRLVVEPWSRDGEDRS